MVEAREGVGKRAFPPYPYIERGRDISYHNLYFLKKFSLLRHLDRASTGKRREVYRTLGRVCMEVLLVRDLRR